MQNNVQIVQNGMNIFKNERLIGKWHNNIAGKYNSTDHILLSSKKYDIGHTPNKLYSMSLIKDNGIKFPEINMSEDLIFNIEAYFTAGNLLAINDCLYNYDRRDCSVSYACRDKKNFVSLYSKFLKL